MLFILFLGFWSYATKHGSAFRAAIARSILTPGRSPLVIHEAPDCSAQCSQNHDDGLPYDVQIELRSTHTHTLKH
jgi:hypothetical protein